MPNGRWRSSMTRGPHLAKVVALAGRPGRARCVGSTRRRSGSGGRRWPWPRRSGSTSSACLRSTSSAWHGSTAATPAASPTSSTRPQSRRRPTRHTARLPASTWRASSRPASHLQAEPRCWRARPPSASACRRSWLAAGRAGQRGLLARPLGARARRRRPVHRRIPRRHATCHGGLLPARAGAGCGWRVASLLARSRTPPPASSAPS